MGRTRNAKTRTRVRNGSWNVTGRRGEQEKTGRGRNGRGDEGRPRKRVGGEERKKGREGVQREKEYSLFLS